MSDKEDNENNKTKDKNPQTNSNSNADSQGESKQENENVGESSTETPRPKGTASEVYGNRNSQRIKRPRKKKSSVTRELRNLTYPKLWEVGRVLPPSQNEDGSFYRTYYHKRRTPDEHRRELSKAYQKWNQIHDSGRGWFPNS